MPRARYVADGTVVCTWCPRRKSLDMFMCTREAMARSKAGGAGAGASAARALALGYIMHAYIRPPHGHVHYSVVELSGELAIDRGPPGGLPVGRSQMRRSLHDNQAAVNGRKWRAVTLRALNSAPSAARACYWRRNLASADDYKYRITAAASSSSCSASWCAFWSAWARERRESSAVVYWFERAPLH